MKKLSKKDRRYISDNFSEKSAKEIADNRGLSVTEVETYIKNFQKSSHGKTAAHVALSSSPGRTFGLDFFEHRGLSIAIALAVWYAVYLSYLSISKYVAYTFNDFDLAIFQQVLHNTTHGAPFESSIRMGVFFKDHLTIVMGLLVPFYVLFQTPLFLLIVQSIAIGSGAVPLYLLARRHINATWGVAFALIYVLYAPIAHANLFEFHTELLATPLLFWAIYCYFEERFINFSIFLFIAVLCKEDIALIAFMFGLYALYRNVLDKREWISDGRRRWILGPSIFGFVYFILALKVIIPAFNMGGYVFLAAHFSNWGEGVFGVMAGILTDPKEVLNTVFATAQATYLFYLFVPVLFLSFCSTPLLLVAAPIFAANLLSSNGANHSIYFQYSASITPFIFASAVMGLRNLLKKKFLYGKENMVLAALLFAGLLSSILIGPHFQLKANFTSERDARDQLRDTFVELIPDDAGVVTTFDFISHVSLRRNLQSAHNLHMGKDNFTHMRYKLPKNIDYALLDLRNTKTWLNFFRWPINGNIQQVLKAEGFGILRSADDLVLYKRGHKAPPPVTMTPPSPRDKDKTTIHYNGGFTMVVKNPVVGMSCKDFQGFKFINLDYYAKPPNNNEHLWQLFMITNSSGSEIHKVFRPLGGPVHPTFSWQVNKWYREKLDLLMPEDLVPGEYKLWMGIISMPVGNYHDKVIDEFETSEPVRALNRRGRNAIQPIPARNVETWDHPDGLRMVLITKWQAK